MKISLNWLKKYVQLDKTPEEISEILTDIGLEVEGLEEYQTIKGGLEGIVVGKVLTCEKHPGADKLSKTTVDLGDGNPTPIVCGAPNVATGQTVVVATVGTTLYSGDESFKIKKSKIRGEVSEGMICAEDELGLGTSHDGIMVLPDEVVAGTPASKHFKIESDYVFEIGLTPNRADAMSHFGVARDLMAYLSVNGGANYELPSVDAFENTVTDEPINLEVVSPELCPRYTGLVIKDVKIAPSPEWMQHALKAIGLTPINNIVDITNYVLHETGQPLHAFDLSEIKGNTVSVRTMPEKTKFTTLDEEERELSEKDLMICNAENGMCIAGVFGGLTSGIKDTTTDLFLESAYFNPVSVRKTAKRHALNTDSSFRFERGIDPNGAMYALKRATMLIQELAGGTIASKTYDTNPAEVPGFEIKLSIDKVQKLIGKEIPSETILSILSALEMTIEKETEDVYKITVPPYRVDVQRQEDLIEDILRIYGYNNVEIPTTIKSALVYSNDVDAETPKNAVADYLVGNGFHEIMCNSLTKKDYYKESENLVEILNPLSNDLNVMRASLIFGGLESATKNINHKRPNIKFFEFGNTYHFDKEKEALKKYSEESELMLMVSGKKSAVNWNTPDSEADYFFLKSHIAGVLTKLNIPADKLKEEKYSDDVITGLSITFNGKQVACFGMVNSKTAKAFDVDAPVYVATLKWGYLISAKKQKTQFSELPKFPEVKRDLSLLLDESVTFEQIKTIAQKTEKKLLKDVSLFDVFTGKGVPEGKKSYAVSFILQDTNKTLVDKQIDKVMNNLIRSYQHQLNAELR
jgi:phenylalanyl-tRNA synthetase beta chain